MPDARAGMVTYEIIATVEPRLVEEYERYMRGRHIPGVLASGCFLEAVFGVGTPGRYRIRYDAATVDDLERYLTTHAPGLREDFVAHFPEGITLSREVWSAIEIFDGPPRPPPRG